MFTVLSNTRNSNLFLIGVLAILMVVLLTFAVAPAISAPEPVIVPVTDLSETSSDYYQRHPELRASAAIVGDVTDDLYQRHPEWISRAAGVATPLAESQERPGMACESPVDCR
jgi:hypothetical protein